MPMEYSLIGVGSSRELLLEPMVRVGFIVEGRDFDVPGLSVHRDRFFERAIGLQPNRRRASGAGEILELLQQPSAQADSARVLGDPHALEFGRPFSVELD